MWDIFDEIGRMQEEMDRIFGDFYGRRYRPMLGPSKALAHRDGGKSYLREVFYDIQETDKEIIVAAELPGMEKGDIKVNVTSDSIDIRAEKKQEKREEKEGAKSYQSYYSEFYRTIPLPSTVEPDKARATYNNGVLEITLQKSEVSVGHKIKIE